MNFGERIAHTYPGLSCFKSDKKKRNIKAYSILRSPQALSSGKGINAVGGGCEGTLHRVWIASFDHRGESHHHNGKIVNENDLKSQLNVSNQ
jgi:hypothetical protein